MSNTTLDRVYFFSATTGTGTITPGLAFKDKYRTLVQADTDGDLTEGDTLGYVIEDGDAWEVGIGTYTTLTLVRTTVLRTSNGNTTLLNLTGNETVFITDVAKINNDKVDTTDPRLPDPAMFGIMDGLAYQKLELTIVNDVGLQLDVEAVGTGDCDFEIDTVRSTLDCTTGAGSGGKARVALTAGVDINNPATNYIYVTDSGGVATLTASTTLPTGAFGWVGKIIVPDATTWASSKAYGFQRYTEAFSNDSRGTQSHTREKLRALGAVYINGAIPTLSITTNAGSADNVHVENTAGEIYQLNRQVFPAFTTGPYYYGNGQNIYESISDLNLALNTQDGTAIGSNDRYNLIIWGAVNINSGECKLFVNLPNTVYSTDSEAQSDHSNTADYSTPVDLHSVAFLIARVALRYSALASGTWTELGVYSLLGTPVGARSGGATSIASFEFNDGQFRVYDNGDATKQVAFEVSGITTATTRTITMPDSDVALVSTPIDSIVGGTDITVDATDPDNPIINYTGEPTFRAIAQAGAQAVVLANDEQVELTTDNTTATLTMAAPSAGEMTHAQLSIVEGVGGNDVAFPAGAKWATGTKPNMTAGDWIVGGSLDPNAKYIFSANSL